MTFSTKKFIFFSKITFFSNNNFINPGQGKIKGLEVQFRESLWGQLLDGFLIIKSSTKYTIADFNKNKQFSADHEKNP